MAATDFSKRSDRALRRATLLAGQFEATMLLVHVVDDDQPRRIVDAERDTATTLLRQMSTTLRDVDGVACETRVALRRHCSGDSRLGDRPSGYRAASTAGAHGRFRELTDAGHEVLHSARRESRENRRFRPET